MGCETDLIIPNDQTLDFCQLAVGTVDSAHSEVAIDKRDLDRRSRVPLVPSNPAADKILYSHAVDPAIPNAQLGSAVSLMNIAVIDAKQTVSGLRFGSRHILTCLRPRGP